jgi:uncharacterized protein (DUF2225 family)
MVSVKDMQIGRKYLVNGKYRILTRKKEHTYDTSAHGQDGASYDLKFKDGHVVPDVDYSQFYQMDPDFYELTCPGCAISGGKKTRRKMKKRKPMKSRKARKSARKSRR